MKYIRTLYRLWCRLVGWHIPIWALPKLRDIGKLNEL